MNPAERFLLVIFVVTAIVFVVVCGPSFFLFAVAVRCANGVNVVLMAESSV